MIKNGLNNIGPDLNHLNKTHPNVISPNPPNRRQPNFNLTRQNIEMIEK